MVGGVAGGVAVVLLLAVVVLGTVCCVCHEKQKRKGEPIKEGDVS